MNTVSTPYPKALEAFLSGAIDLSSDTIKAAMVTSAYTYSASHQYYSSVSGVVGTPVTLGSKTVTGGVFTAGPFTFTSVAAGQTVVAVVIYKDTGSAGTSPLLAYIGRRADTVPLGIITNGGNITLGAPARGIFRI